MLNKLFEFRGIINDFYGTENLAILLYALVRMQQPKIVIELGSGTGLLSVFVAQALKENNLGHLWSIDCGEDSEFLKFKDYLRKRKICKEFFFQSKYSDYLNSIRKEFNLEKQISFISKRIDLEELSNLHVEIPQKSIDWIISDFMHSPEDTLAIISHFLPFTAPYCSFFIDSVPTKLNSFLVLQTTIAQLNVGKLPRAFIEGKSGAEIDILKEHIQKTKFELIPLNEAIDRMQNSTAWIRMYPADYLPYPITSYFINM